MATKNNPPKCRKNDIVTQDLKGELLIYDLTINKAYCLNGNYSGSLKSF